MDITCTESKLEQIIDFELSSEGYDKFVELEEIFEKIDTESKKLNLKDFEQN